MTACISHKTAAGRRRSAGRGFAFSRKRKTAAEKLLSGGLFYLLILR